MKRGIMSSTIRIPVDKPCYNKVSLKHFDSAEVKRAFDAFNNKRLFEEFIPFPPGLKQLEPLKMREGSFAEKKAAQESRILQFGFSDWFHFAHTKWGTAVDVGVNSCVNSFDENSITLSFETVIHPPIGFYFYLDKFGWDVDAFYYAPEIGQCGTFSYYDRHMFYSIPDCEENLKNQIPPNILNLFSDKIVPYKSNKDASDIELIISVKKISDYPRKLVI